MTPGPFEVIEMSMFQKATKHQAKGRISLTGKSGGGKAQPTHCKVLTPAGWRPIGELAIGDTVVDPDGGMGTVEAVFPQGKKEAFRVLFNDGSSTECCDEHLWLTQNILDRAAKRPGIARPLSEIRATLTRNFPACDDKANHYIPMVAPIDIGSSELPIDPWLLGVIIGDGGLTGNAIIISKPGAEIRSAVAACIPGDLTITEVDGVSFAIRKKEKTKPHSMVATLRDLGLMGKKSTEKEIPASYLFSSFANRVALFQGLIDTDGYINNHQTEFSTSSTVLAQQFRELVQSIGGTCSFNARIPKYTHNGEKRVGAKNWRMMVSLPANIPPARLSAKLDKHVPRTKYPPYRSFSDVSSVGEKECVCIRVSTKRNLYVTDDYIVTHNTFSALAIASHLGGRVALIDTERGSAKKYATREGEQADPKRGKFDFFHLDLETYDPRKYVEAIEAAEAEGFNVLIIDSLSHAWMGKGGALEMVDNAAKKGGNSYTAWRDVTPLQNQLVDAIVGAKMHVIATMRSKTEYVVEKNDKGKSVPRKVGTQPIQREGMEYEFDVTADMTDEGVMVIDKTRCPELAGKVFRQPGKDVADILREWLADGDVVPTPVVADPSPAPVPPPSEPKSGPALVTGGAPATVNEEMAEVCHKFCARILDADEEGMKTVHAEAKAALKGQYLDEYKKSFNRRYRELFPKQTKAVGT